MEIDVNKPIYIENHHLYESKYAIQNNGLFCNIDWAYDLKLSKTKFIKTLVNEYNAKFFHKNIFLFEKKEDAKKAVQWLENIFISFKLAS